MIKKGLVILCIQLALTSITFGQNLNLDEYDVFIRDTLINKSDFIEKGNTLDSARLKHLSFKPITDGQKTFYYLSGAVYAVGEIKNKKENGYWTYWHENGKKARQGNYLDGKREGTHTYWYPNGNSRGIGNFKNDKYDGKWTMYNEDGTKVSEQIYKDNALVKEK